MSKLKRTITFMLLTIFIMVNVDNCKVLANTNSQDGIEVELHTENDKINYISGDETKLMCTVRNSNSFDVNDVDIEIKLPDGVTTNDKKQLKRKVSLKAGETTDLIVNVKISNKQENQAEINATNIGNSTPKQTKTPNTGDLSQVFFGIIIALTALFIIAFIKKKGKKIIAFIIAVSMIISEGAIIQVKAQDEVCTLITHYEVKVGDKSYDFVAKVNYPYISEMGRLKINTDNFVYEENENHFLVNSKIDSLTGVLESSQKYSKIELRVYNEKENLVFEDSIEAVENWQFNNIGLFLGENKVEILAKGDDESISTSAKLYDPLGLNFSNVKGSSIDSDNDGLVDLLEEYYGTDKNEVDTDKDGLTDFQELTQLKTDPLKVYTNDNGVSDYDEDKDEDGLSNGYEYYIGTNPIEMDSDNDGLNDGDEINNYKTNPLDKDTDGDGATDFWEIENGFDPLTFDNSFVIEESFSDISNANPVVASVQTSVKGNQINSLNVQQVDYSDYNLISDCIPGYMGDAYEFSIDGEINEATLTFSYDTKLGTVGNAFQPRIYYINEKTGLFEELDDQQVEDGKVTAKTNHFSKYILLNKVAFDEAWDNDIKLPDDENQNKGLSVAFVIDRSSSMDENDPEDLRKQLTKDFINKMNFDKDDGSVVSFIAKAEVKTELTNDKQKLIEAVDGIYNDSGWGWNSGTNGSAGIYEAINQLLGDESGNQRYIIFMTDGEDTQVSYSYDELIDLASNNGINIFSIGLGSANETLLKGIAEKTGGKYYYAEKADDLSQIYDNISIETIDYTTDSNNDGISDYYTKLIKDGELTLANHSDEFIGIDFNYDKNGNFSEDYDGDGLKNGDEINVKVDYSGKPYLYMISDPTLVHSDMDEVSDYDEIKKGTNPLETDYNKSSIDYLTNDSNYYYEDYVNMYDDSLLYQIDSSVLSAITLNWNTGEIYRDILTDYFNTYVEDVNSNSDIEKRKILLDNCDKLLGYLNSAKDTIDNIDKFIELKDNIKNLVDIINGYSSTIDYISVEYQRIAGLIAIYDARANTLILKSYTLSRASVGIITSKTALKAGDVSKFGIVLNWATSALDVADTISSFAKVSANNRIFDENMDYLMELRDNCKRANISNAASTVINYLGQGYGNAISESIKAVGKDGVELMLNLAVTFASVNPYVSAVVFVRDMIDLVTGLSPTLEREYKMLAYDSMSYTARVLACNSYNGEAGFAYDITPNKDLERYLTNIAQIRILGEKMYAEYYTHGAVSWMINKDDINENTGNVISNVKLQSKKLKLKLSSKL